MHRDIHIQGPRDSVLKRTRVLEKNSLWSKFYSNPVSVYESLSLWKLKLLLYLPVVGGFCRTGRLRFDKVLQVFLVKSWHSEGAEFFPIDVQSVDLSCKLRWRSKDSGIRRHLLGEIVFKSTAQKRERAKLWIEYIRGPRNGTFNGGWVCETPKVGACCCSDPGFIAPRDVKIKLGVVVLFVAF